MTYQPKHEAVPNAGYTRLLDSLFRQIMIPKQSLQKLHIVIINNRYTKAINN